MPDRLIVPEGAVRVRVQRSGEQFGQHRLVLGAITGPFPHEQLAEEVDDRAAPGQAGKRQDGVKETVVQWAAGRHSSTQHRPHRREFPQRADGQPGDEKLSEGGVQKLIAADPVLMRPCL